ncbi:hypothetical protein VMT65_04035 [Nocardia sp. CDC153]|nr:MULTISPECIES: hypothetical protein [unclassified Nocardia]MEC3916635.1 hypothetical protein [Nocardia sp. CDC160]MEC3952197.1 hypothetical protein [Nocardia sp. CDC153]
MSDQDSNTQDAAAAGIAAMMAAWDIKGSDEAKADGDAPEK